MADTDRLDLIKQLQAKRDDRLCIAYVTSTRSGHEIQIADDVLRRLYDHLIANREGAAKGVDLFIHSNGGSGSVPWRLVSLIREFTKSFALLVPHHAFSAATLIGLGADEIVMHRMGCLGPIDPSVANAFNPPNPYQAGRVLPISVEDVSAYIKLVKEDFGVRHEDELIQAFSALTSNVHPLALGNVQRHHHQSRMMARKLLRKHMIGPEEEHEIQQIIDHLKSNLFFHGHPICRDEARHDLNLKVKDASPDLEEVMWALYLQYEDALQMLEPFSPLNELDKVAAAPAGAQGGGVAAMPPGVPPMMPQGARLEMDLAGAYLESLIHTHVYKTKIAINRVMINTPQGPQAAVGQEELLRRWEKTR